MSYVVELFFVWNLFEIVRSHVQQNPVPFLMKLAVKKKLCIER